MRLSRAAARARAVAPALAAAVAVTAFYWGALVSDRTVQAMPVDDDVTTYFRPLTIDQFAYAHAHGSLPQWLSRAGLGYPAALVGQHGTMYPPRIAALAWAGSPGSAADFLVWAHALLAAVAASVLARLLRIGRWWAALAGTLYALSDLVVRWAPLYHSPPYFAAFPLAWLGVELAARRRPLVGVPLLGLGIGVSGLGSHLQNTHLLVQAVAVVALYRVATAGTVRRALEVLGASALGAGAGLAIAAPVWLPFALEQPETTRQSSTFGQIVGMDSHTILSIVDQTAALRQLNGDLYLGLVAPPLVVVGLLASLRRARLALLPLLLGVSLLVGYKTALLRFLMAVVPGWSVVSNVQRLSFVAVLTLALLAGVGGETIVRVAGRRVWAVAAVLVAGTAAAWQSVVALRRVESPWVWGVASAALVAAVALAALRPWRERVVAAVAFPLALLVLSTVGAMGARSLGWRPVPDRPPAKFQRWLPLVAANDDPSGRWMSYCADLQAPGYLYRPIAFLEVRGRWLDTYDSFVTRRYYDYWRALTGSTLYERPIGGQWYQGTPGNPPPNAALVDAAGIDRILAQDGGCPVPAGWRAVARGGGFSVYRNDGAFPLAYVSHSWTTVASPAQAVERLAAARAAPFASHRDLVVGGPAAGTGGPAVPARLERRDAQHLTVILPAQARPSLVVVLEAWDRGWHARAAGRAQPVRIVNGVFRGVVVPAGVTRVELAFDPWWLTWLPPLAGAATALLLLVPASAWLVRRRRVSRPDAGAA